MNDSSISTITRATAAVIGLAGVVIVIWIIMAGGWDNMAPIHWGVILSYIAIGIAGVAAILFGIFGLAMNFKQKMPFIIGIVVLGIVCLVAWMIAGSETAPYDHIKTMEVTEGVSKYAGTVMNFFYLLLGIAIVAVVATIGRDFYLKMKK